MSHLVLASASPRRHELLTQLGATFTVHAADIDEACKPAESPEAYVSRMAREKAQAVAALPLAEGARVLGADTTVVVDEQVLGKPENREQAHSILRMLSGRSHRVLTAVTLCGGGEMKSVLVATQVVFCALSDDDIHAYLESGEAWDKAGAYGIQGLAGAFVSSINGSYSNVVGLPVHETWQLLKGFGIATGLNPGQSQ
jgi:nucleoside triphosphate pyrophosphatase